MDLSTLSNEELLAMRERAVRQTMPQQSAADLANMTDGELIALARLGALPPAPEGAVIHGPTGGAGDVGVSSVVGRPDMTIPRTGDLASQQRALAALSERASGEASVAAPPRQMMPFLQGFTASGGDEAVSAGHGLRAVISGEEFRPAYDYAQTLQQQQLDQERTENPGLSMIAQVGGAITSGGLAAPMIPRAFLGGGTLAGQTLRSGALGAAGGTVEGFLSGNDATGRMNNARDGLILGGALGGALPTVFAGARAGVERIADSATTDRMLRSIGLDRSTGDMVRRALDADMAAGGQTALRQAGPDAMLADAGGATRGVVDTAIQRGGGMSSSAMQAIDTRVANSYNSLTQRMDSLLGSPEGVLQRQEAIRAGSAPARRATYDAAYAVPIDYTSAAGRRIETLLDRVTPQALNEANTLMRLRGERSNQILFDVADDGTVTFRTVPDVRQIDYITRGLNRLAASGESTGALGARTDMSDALSDLAMDIRTTLRTHIPEYDLALKTARDAIEEKQAIDIGFDALKPGTRRMDFLLQVHRMGDDVIPEVRAGMREYIDHTISNVKTAISNFDADEFPRARAALMELTTDSAQTKLRRVLSPDEFTALSDEIAQAARALILKGDVAINSRTFGRQSVTDAARQALEPGPIGQAKRGAPVEAGKRAVQTFFGTRPQDDLAREDELFSGVLRFLAQPRGADGSTDAYRALSDAYRTQGQNAILADNIARVTATGTGAGAYQGGQLQLGTR